MTAAAGTSLGALRARYGEAFGARLPDHIWRLSWDAGRLARHQRERLRALLLCAVERSPFHARRLRGIDPGRFELDDLAGLPVMSKEQMMASFDELVTDRRLTRARAEAHLACCAEEPSLLGGQYVCLASGGSSGQRGLFVQSIEEFAEFSASVLRRLIARLAAVGPPPSGAPVALIGAASPVHASGFAAAALAASYPVRAISAPAAKVLLTNLYNHTQPLIRYELTDRFTRHPAEPGSGQLRATVQGRADDTFHYGTIPVDPLAIRTVMVRTPAALEYQVRQTPGGIDIAVVASGPLDHTSLAAALEESLHAAGLPDPQVLLRQVPDIARHPETGKARRFIPL